MALSSENQRTRTELLKDLYESFQSLLKKRNATLHHDEDRMIVKETNEGTSYIWIVNNAESRYIQSFASIGNNLSS